MSYWQPNNNEIKSNNQRLNNIDLIILCFDISKSDQLSTRCKSKATES